MSVVKKMVRVSSEEDTLTYLNSIHSNMQKKIHKRKVQTEEKQAAQLQIFLRQIKYLQKQYKVTGAVDYDNMPFADFWDKAAQKQLMELMYNAHPQLLQYNLLNFMSDDSYVLGQKLEQGLAQILNTFESAVTGEDYGFWDDKSKTGTGIKAREKTAIAQAHRIGGKQIQVPNLVGVGNEIMKNEFNKLYERVQEEAKKYRKEDDGIANYMPGVQGKIDINGFNGELAFTMDVQLNTYAKSMMKALTHATFTAKNYALGHGTMLHFGHTNPFRVLASVAPQGLRTINRFGRMRQCFISHTSYHEEAPSLFYKIRAMYELTGVGGAKYIDKDLQNILKTTQAKFLIYNEPNGDNIYVIPTQKIVDNIIEQIENLQLSGNWEKALYGTISIKKASITELAQY